VSEQARLKVLEEAGWRPDRRVSTAEQERALLQNGFASWPDLAAFLRQYDGLTLRFVRRRSGRRDAIKLDASWAAAVADGEWMTRYSELAGARLASIGAAYSEHLLIWLTEDGRFFATYDTCLRNSAARRASYSTHCSTSASSLKTWTSSERRLEAHRQPGGNSLDCRLSRIAALARWPLRVLLAGDRSSALGPRGRRDRSSHRQ
jgi:hypothetical protein